MSALIEALGTARVLEPPGALPQGALRLDATLPMRRYEIEVDVDTLCVDSTSFRQLVQSSDGNPDRVGEAILSIVAQRGKMHNPVTGSGGILTGTVRAVGDDYPDPPPIGLRIVTLASLTLTPLRSGHRRTDRSDPPTRSRERDRVPAVDGAVDRVPAGHSP